MAESLKFFGMLYFYAGLIMSLALGATFAEEHADFSGPWVFGTLAVVVVSCILTFFVPAKIIQLLEDIRDENRKNH